MSQMFLNVVSTFKGDGITQATRQLGAFGKQTSSFGSILGKVGGALASFGLATKAIRFGRESIEQARDLERNLFALDTVFDDLAPGMREFAKNAENIGLSQSKAAKASTFIGSVLKQSGFEMSAVAEETENLVRLGTDLAALYGYDVQEALLGMTALFRGEYDPIEKFGVAMKQQEINSELAARGQDKLEGAARRNAEQTVRLELLYQRAADAMGAFSGQAGSLYTEQKKLGATFENMQAQLGTALLPAVSDLNRELRKLLGEITPGLIQIFGVLAEVLEGILGIFRDAVDPTTELGESFTALGLQFEATIASIFGEGFKISDIFNIASEALRIFLDLLHDVMRIIEAIAISARVAFDGLQAILGPDKGRRFWDEFVGSGENAIITQMNLSNAVKDFKLQSETASDSIKDLRESVAEADKGKLERLKEQLFGIRISARESANEMRRFREQAGLPAIGKKTTTSTSTETNITTGGAGKQVAAALSVTEQLEQTQALSVKKATAQGKLLGIGLEQGVVNQILAMSKPVKSANDLFNILTKKNGELTKKGVAKVKEYNDTFNAGIEQVNQRAAEAASAAAAAAQEAQRQADELRRAEEARIEGLNQLYANFLETIKGTFAGIRNAIQGAFDITGLGGSTNAIIRNMNKLLAKMKSFSANVKSLATMGLDPALLQQVIQAGPVAGSRLAAALVAGGAGALGDINAGFMQASSLASEIAQTGVSSLFDTQKQQNVYNITVTGGVGSGSTIGKAIVDAIKDYERTSGAVWQGA
jgi:hypothetical protein